MNPRNKPLFATRFRAPRDFRVQPPYTSTSRHLGMKFFGNQILQTEEAFNHFFSFRALQFFGTSSALPREE
jgi:hypothetical protein